MTKTRHIYEVTEISVGPLEAGHSAILLIDTSGPIDLALHASRETLVRLRDHLAHELSATHPSTDQA